MKMRNMLLLCCMLLFANTVSAQHQTTKGKEFYLTFLYHADGLGIVTAELYLTATQNTTGNIVNPYTGYNQPFSIAAGSVTQVTIPKSEAMNVIEGSPQNKGLIITASDTIAAFALSTAKASSDAANLIQKEALGTSYLIACYDGFVFSQNFQYKSTFAVEATEDSTMITIIPSVATTKGDPAGVPISVMLNKGQTYLVKALANLSGSRVFVTNGCKKIAVFSGADVNFIPSYMVTIRSADHLYEQLFPINSFGRQFITTKFKGRNVYRARVYAAYDNTAITIDGVNVSTINAGQFYEFESMNIPKFITTSNPAEMVMFATSYEYDQALGPYNEGDPTMMVIPPIEQQLTESIFLSPATGSITDHKVNIICKTADVYSTVLDGINVGDSFAVVSGNPLYSYAAINIKAGQHNIQNPKGFIAYSYGFGRAQGYGYCTGASVDKIDAYFTCNNISSIGSPTIDVCTGPAVFDIITSQTNAGYTWDFGDGSAKVTTDGTVLQQTHNYPISGNYKVTLTTVSSVGNACAQSTADTTSLTLHVVSSLVPSVKMIASPAGATCAGRPLSFIATATNAGVNPIYQWKLNGMNIGTNKPTYTDSAFKNGDKISCVVTSSLSCASAATSADSMTIAINASVIPTISIATDSLNVCTGYDIKVTALPSQGIQSPVYQWKVNNVNKGTDSSIFNYQPMDGDIVSCVLTAGNKCAVPQSIQSNNIKMSVQAGVSKPSVSISTAQQIICNKTNAVFTAIPVNGGTTPTYQWKKNGVNVGINNAVYSDSSLNNNDIVSCVLTSNQPCLASATAVSNTITMTVNPLIVPAVNIQTPATTICAGTVLSVTANPVNGGSNPIYQWSVNNIPVVNNGPVFTFNNSKDGDKVSCNLVSNATCAVNPAISNSITITVNQKITTSVTVQPSANRICQGSQVTFTAMETNGGNTPVYDWFINGSKVNIENKNSFSSTTLLNGDKIACRLISSLGCTDTTTSSEQIIRVDPLPTVVFNPVEELILLGSAVTLKPVVTGNIGMYEWSPPDNLDATNTRNVIANPEINKTYQLAITTVDDCKASATIVVKVFGDIIMPNSFTPNGDGKNDVFRVPPRFNVPIRFFAIYNRWSEKIFDTNDVKNGWNGTRNGVLSDAGAYTWILQYENPFNGQLVQKKGAVLLIR